MSRTNTYIKQIFLVHALTCEISNCNVSGQVTDKHVPRQCLQPSLSKSNASNTSYKERLVFTVQKPNKKSIKSAKENEFGQNSAQHLTSLTLPCSLNQVQVDNKKKHFSGRSCSVASYLLSPPSTPNNLRYWSNLVLLDVIWGHCTHFVIHCQSYLIDLLCCQKTKWHNVGVWGRQNWVTTQHKRF